ncbi:MAG: hypothetical protein KC621_28545 [Myxococcales bacterium]|nr:hypothetical protein [Myxococcales bacterium]
MWMWFLAAHAEPTAPPVVDEMHQRYGALTSARDAVIDGDLAKVKTHATTLSDLGSDTSLPNDWRPYVARVNAAAQRLHDATDLVGAAVGVANVASACAECHDALNGGPKLDHRDAVPPQKWTEGQNMPLHKWSADWLWLGLLANDDASWNRGAGELDKMPLVPKFEQAPPNGMRELEQGVYVIAGRARTVDDPNERAELYGQLLATCSQCHTQHRNLAPTTAPAPAAQEKKE